MDVLIKKADSTITVDEARFSPDVRAYLFAYGVRQRLNDSIASMKSGEVSSRDMVAHVESILERFYAGDLRATRAAAVQTVEGLALRKATKIVMDAWLRKYPKGDIKEFKNRGEVAKAYLAKTPALLAIAQQELELTSGDVDIDV